MSAFVGRIEKYQQAVERAPTQMLRAIAPAGRAAFLIEAQKASGGDGRLSHVGKSGARLGVSAKVDTAAQTVTFKAAGPWQLVEFKTKSHIIASKRFRGNRVGRGGRVAAGGAKLQRGFVGRREAAIRTPYGPRMFVRHPGTRNPKQPWAKGRVVVLQIAPRIAQETAKNELRKAAL